MLRTVIANVIVFVVGLLAIELAGRVFFYFRPAYHVLHIEPDRVTGWKQLAGHNYVWTGMYWWAADFSAPIRVNSHGFRDHERKLDKPTGTTRVGILGESYAEAMQVPIEETGAQLLEEFLNEAAGDSSPFEVLNFAVTKYSLGQYLLTWEEAASRFDLDHVIILVSSHVFRRTVTRYETGAFATNRGKSLWVRPTFRLEGERLVREPAADYDAFVESQKTLIANRFGGSRSRRRDSSLVSRVFQKWTALGQGGEVDTNAALPSKTASPTEFERYSSSDIVGVNMAVLEELRHQVVSSGATLTLVDLTQYIYPTAKKIPAKLRRYSAEQGVGFVPLSDRLREANENSVATKWAHDGHFNEDGNRIFAEAMFDSLAADGVVQAPLRGSQ